MNMHKMKFYIKTYGCQMNQRDSEATAAMLIDKGLECVSSENEADVLIFNTCSVRKQAEVKAIGKMGILKRLKKNKPGLIFGVMGCMAQNRQRELFEKLPHLDFIVGTEQLHHLPEILMDVVAGKAKQVNVRHGEGVLTGLSPHLPPKHKGFSSFIAIMRGCNRFCTYCIVPYVRGREKSRAIEDIVSEARGLARAGAKEIFLLGQNVAAYGLDGKAIPEPDSSPFARLLGELDAIPEISRIRFTSPHPAYFNDALVNAIATLPKVCDSVHLPLQSGSDKILRAMNRRYTSEHYMEIVGKLKAKVPGITFSTDIIVGFPGETDEDFNVTRDLMNEVGFDNAYIFKYSPRQGTKAAGMRDDVPKAMKERRNQILLAELEKRAREHNEVLVGRTFEILVEGPSKRNPSRWSGRTTSNKVVIFEPEESISTGCLIEVKIDRSTPMTLFGSAI
jgi:tRNA-2-methylthio-N6-dimethylallyladenosine synthase